MWDYPAIEALAQHLTEKIDVSLPAVKAEPDSKEENLKYSQDNTTDKIDQGDVEQLLVKLERLSEQEVDSLLGKLLEAQKVSK
jgi:hypothetical protein